MTQTDKQQRAMPAAIRLAAMDLLTGREYARSELSAKLIKCFDHNAAVEAVLDQLQAQNLQSDQRYAEAFVRSKIHKGHGLARIRLDIRRRGIDDKLLDAVVQQAQIDWFLLARQVALRKFGSVVATDQKDKAKRIRFLQYRGFDFEQIKFALSDSDMDGF